MYKHKQLAVLLLMFGPLFASAAPIDNLFSAWRKSYYTHGIISPVAPPPDNTGLVVGGSFYIVDNTLPVEFTFVSSDAGFDLVLSVASRDSNGDVGPWEQVFVKKGNSVYKGPEKYYIEPKFFSYYAGAAEIFIRLDAHSPKTGSDYTYYSGPGSNNFDGDAHAVSFYDYHDGKTLVGFEDKNRFNNSDWDYDDIVFLVSNVSAVPEPETWAMLLAGLGIIGAVARRRKTDL